MKGRIGTRKWNVGQTEQVRNEKKMVHIIIKYSNFKSKRKIMPFSMFLRGEY